MKKPKPDAAERWVKRHVVRSELSETLRVSGTKHSWNVDPPGGPDMDFNHQIFADILRAYDRSKRRRKP